MVALAEIGPNIRAVSPEQSSFDVNASIYMMRHDIYTHGQILPETRKRVHDEEMTLIAEGINRPLESTFRLQEINGELAIFDKGEWSPYMSTLIRGQETTQREARDDPRKQFLADWAIQDTARGYQMQALKAGEIVTWGSPFPDFECQMYGAKFINSLGLNAERRMGFLYRAQKNDDGSVTLQTMSVDNSDEDAFNRALNVDANSGMHAMRNAYDQAMQFKFGGQYQAGRKTEGTPEEEACAFIEKHERVFEYYIDQIESLALSGESGQQLESSKKRLTYGTWALIKELLTHKDTVNFNTVRYAGFEESVHELSGHDIGMRIEEAFIAAQARGEMLIACGGSIGAEDIFSMSASEVFDMIFGKETKSTTSKIMKCVNCPECKTFHEEVAPKDGMYRCANEDCDYTVAAN